MSDVKNVSRRKFVRQVSCAGMGYMTLMNSLLNFKAMNAAAISNSSINGYKAIVCILQAGGNDSFNMLIPRNTSKYNEYLAARSNLAIPQNEILPIYPTNSDGNQYGVHPNMSGVQNLFNSGKLSFLTNVGTLIGPLTKSEYVNNSVSLPLGLFSHSDQIQQWQTAILDNRTITGWGGKIADLIGDQNGNPRISMNVTLSGTNIFQTGNNTIEYAISNEGSIGMQGHNPQSDWIFEQLKTQAINNIIEHNYQDIFKNTYAKTLVNARDNHAEFTSALNTFNGFAGGMFNPENPVSQDLRMIAHTIAVRNTLDFKRQIFFVTVGGWDHHDELLDTQYDMLGGLSQALSEFNTGLQAIGMENDVLTFTISEFGRTLTSNGDGTDHAWGGNVMVMGGNSLINGQKIYGTYPSLILEGPSDVGDGVILPTTSTDEYFAEISKWFGVPNSDLGFLFPQLGNFYNINSNAMPIGFINA